MEKSKRRLKPVKVRVIQQPPWPEIHAVGQSVAHPSVRQFQDRCDDSLDQVGYARSQGRRLKEFQISYLERKFFYLWAKRTFGPVLPSKARCLYEQKILQKNFQSVDGMVDCLQGTTAQPQSRQPLQALTPQFDIQGLESLCIPATRKEEQILRCRISCKEAKTAQDLAALADLC